MKKKKRSSHISYSPHSSSPTHRLQSQTQRLLTASTGSKEQQARAHNAQNTHNALEKRLCRLELPCVHKRETDDTHSKNKGAHTGLLLCLPMSQPLSLIPTRKGTTFVSRVSCPVSLCVCVCWEAADVVVGGCRCWWGVPVSSLKGGSWWKMKWGVFSPSCLLNWNFRTDPGHSLAHKCVYMGWGHELLSHTGNTTFIFVMRT